MESIKDKLQKLLETDEWTREEKKWLLNYIENNNTTELQQLLKQLFIQSGDQFENKRTHRDEELILEQIHQKLGLTSKSIKIIRFTAWRQIAAIGFVFIMLTSLYYIFNNNKQFSKNTNTEEIRKDILPGGNKAILTLADGTKIVLDTAKKGEIAHQANTKIVKLDDGQMSYNAENSTSNEILYNTITTPRGGQYQLVLPDNSIVYLNASSSIRFPVAFSGEERKVEITGEAYFEVTRNEKMPFKVIANNVEIKVLGTHFNVNAYEDESLTATTLLEGKVVVNSKGNSVNLIPGQQALSDSQGNVIVAENVNVDEAVAWKDGLFMFNSLSIEDIMRQVSRWYNVDVVYEGAKNKKTFSGIISRQSNLSKVLNIMKIAGVEFKVDENKITVIQN